MAPPAPEPRWPLEASLYFFHHVFLPPKVPQKDDYNCQHEVSLLNCVINSLQSFGSHVSDQEEVILTTIMKMMSRLSEICDSHGGINEEKLIEGLKELTWQGKK